MTLRTDTRELAARAALVRAAARLHARGLLAGTEGNLSVRLPNNQLIATPAGADKATLHVDDLVVLVPEGPLGDSTGAERHIVTSWTLSATDAAAGRAASSEIRMHCCVYAARTDVGAVIHAHPPAATAFAAAGRTMPHDVLPELIVNVGPVSLVPYGRPGTDALADAMEPYVPDSQLFLLANHGVTSVGASLDEALHRLESCEQAARILLGAQLLGGAVPLPVGEHEALETIRRQTVESTVIAQLESQA